MFASTHDHDPFRRSVSEEEVMHEIMEIREKGTRQYVAFRMSRVRRGEVITTRQCYGIKFKKYLVSKVDTYIQVRVAWL